MVDVLAVMGLGLYLICALVYGLGLRASIASPSTESQSSCYKTGRRRPSLKNRQTKSVSKIIFSANMKKIF
jgi:hypothetical protein